MQKAFPLVRTLLVCVISGSFILSPVIPVYARGRSEVEINIPGPPVPPGFPAPPGLKVTSRHLPPGIPVPVPVPRVSVEVERHHDRGRSDRHYRPDRYERRDYSRHKSDWRHDRDKYRHWYRPHGSHYRSIPAEAFALSVAGGMFFFHMGNYYRRTNDGYVVVQAPLGARVRTLPDNCSSYYVDGRRYVVCDDVYYEPDGDEYIVIERPARGDYRIEVGDEVRVKAESLNVRSGPGTRYEVVYQLYRGDVVEVGGIDADWYYVTLPNGSYGWVLREYTDLYRTRHEIKG